MKWNKKIAVQHLTELKSPFENQNGQRPLPNLAEKIRALATRNKGV